MFYIYEWTNLGWAPRHSAQRHSALSITKMWHSTWQGKIGMMSITMLYVTYAVSLMLCHLCWVTYAVCHNGERNYGDYHYAEWHVLVSWVSHLCCVSLCFVWLMLSETIIKVTMLSVCYAMRCRLCWLSHVLSDIELSATMLSAIKLIKLSATMLSAIMLSPFSCWVPLSSFSWVPLCWVPFHAECQYSAMMHCVVLQNVMASRSPCLCNATCVVCCKTFVTSIS